MTKVKQSEALRALQLLIEHVPMMLEFRVWVEQIEQYIQEHPQ